MPPLPDAALEATRAAWAEEEDLAGPTRGHGGVSPADQRSRGERAAAPGDGGLFLETGAATAGGLPWATAAAVRERGAAAAAAPGVTVHYKRAQEPGSA